MVRRRAPYRGLSGALPVLAAMPSVVVGGNETDVHLQGVVPGRDFSLERVLDLRNAVAGDFCPRCGTAMVVHQGIEVCMNQYNG